MAKLKEPKPKQGMASSCVVLSVAFAECRIPMAMIEQSN